MLQAVIIDDEPKARENLANMLEEHCPQVKVVAEEGTVKAAKKAIRKHQPDVVLLDIKMQNETGFDLLESLNNIAFEIIFVTAYDQYAIKAFQFSAMDYLLKPINADHLKQAVKKVEEKKEQKLTYDKLHTLLQNIENVETGFHKLALPTLDGLTIVQLQDIVRCESEDNYTRFFFTDNKEMLVSKTIKHFEELLAEHNFFRVHQSHLINLHHVKEYVKGVGGYVVMSDGGEVMVSKRRKQAFLQELAAI